MAGANVWGRILADALRQFEPVIINEQGTQRADKLAQWLSPDYGPSLGEHVVSSNALLQVPACDYIINGGVGAIFKSDLLSRPSIGLLNAHPGLLPEYRGLDPVCWALNNGDPQGATVHFMDEGIDTGPILIRRVLKNTNANSLVDLRLEVLEFASHLMWEYLNEPESFPPRVQRQDKGNYYGRFEDPGRLDLFFG